MLATTLLTESFVGPGTFQSGLELYDVAGPAGLYLIKLKVGHCPHPFRFMSFGPPIPQIQHFQNLTLKIQGQEQMTDVAQLQA